MAAKHVNAKTVARDRYGIYWEKAQEFMETMVDAAVKRNWNAVGLAGVHSVICATDALLVKYAGVRSSADSHQDVVGLLRGRIQDAEMPRQCKRLSEILAQKNLIEYIDRSYPEKEALALKLSVERYLAWVTKIINA